MCLTGAVGAGDLSDLLKPEYAAAPKLAQPRESIFQPVDVAQRIEFVDNKPQPLVAFRAAHRLENRDPHPGVNETV